MNFLRFSEAMNHNRVQDIYPSIQSQKTTVLPVPFTSSAKIADSANFKHALKATISGYPKVMIKTS